MNNNSTITAGKIAELVGVTERAAQKWAVEQNWEFDPGSNGTKHYYRDRLPPGLQERIFRSEHGLDEVSIEAMVERCGLRVPEKKKNDPATATKIRMVCECLAVPDVRGRDRRIKEIAENHGYTRATAYRLMSRARAGEWIEAETRNHGWSLPGLGITLRAWDEESGRIAIETILANRRNHVEKLTLYESIKARIMGHGSTQMNTDQSEGQGQNQEQTGLDIKAKSEDISHRGTEGTEKNIKIGSYSSFLDLAAKLAPGMHTYKDTGIRGLREDLVPAIRRDFTEYRPMECLVGDQHKADYYAVDQNGEIVTLELFCWLDFRSQMVWPALAYKHYNRYTVGQALINACRWGLPASLYTDWGKPEESDYMTQLREQLSGLGVEIQHIHAKVRHPQAKPIEGWFSWLDQALRNAGVPGYMKRLGDTRSNEMAQKELRATDQEGRLLPVEELVEQVIAVVQGWNEHRYKNRGCDNGKTPQQVYAEETLKTPATTLSNEMLEYIFLPVYTQNRNHQPIRVRRSQVKIWHPIWKRLVTYYDPELSSHLGEEVEVRYNPFDVKRAWIFDRRPTTADRSKKTTGSLICCAEEWGMINPKDHEAVAEKIEKQEALIKKVRDTYRMYVPEKKPIRRLDPRERAAKEVAKQNRTDPSDLTDGTNDEGRVMRTPLDNPIRQVAHGNVIDMRTGEVPEDRPTIVWKKEEKKTGYTRFFDLDMEKPAPEE